MDFSTDALTNAVPAGTVINDDPVGNRVTLALGNASMDFSTNPADWPTSVTQIDGTVVQTPWPDGIATLEQLIGHLFTQANASA